MPCTSPATLLFCLFLTPSVAALAATCPVLHAGTPTPAQDAFLHADYGKAAMLYRQQLADKPDDPATTAALSRVLLRQQEFMAAEQLVGHALSVHPHNGLLEAAQAGAELRAGEPWAALPIALAALKDNPCEPQAHHIMAQLQRLNSNYATEQREIDMAHQLDPDDPEIYRQWIITLPLEQRSYELRSYLSKANSDGLEDHDEDLRYLGSLQTELGEPQKVCHLIGPNIATHVSIAPLMGNYEERLSRPLRLEVKLNGRSSQLEIGTDTSGIMISRKLEEQAHLKRLPDTAPNGSSDRGLLPGHFAYADDIRIGGLEFQDCIVKVLDRDSDLTSDGKIGLDAFSAFLIGLDYPKHDLTLAPLPSRPEANKMLAPRLQTFQTGGSRSTDYLAASEWESAASSPQISPIWHDRYVAPEMKGYHGFYRDGFQILLPTQLNNTSQRLFLIDAGSFPTMISADAARDVTKITVDDHTRILGNAGNNKKAFVAHKVTLRFAGILQESEDLRALDLSTFSKYSGIEISGWLGLGSMQKLVVHIDYRDGLIRFD